MKCFVTYQRNHAADDERSDALLRLLSADTIIANRQKLNPKLARKGAELAIRPP